MERSSTVIATRWVHIAARVLMTVLFSVLVAELAGYWLRRLLHSNKIRFLSRGHLIHHFLIYSPRQPKPSRAGYRDATHNRLSVGNIGLEWLIPSGIVLAVCWAALILFRVPRAYQVAAVCGLLAWLIFMLSYLHNRMHEQSFWMTRVPLLKNWFLRARRPDDIHHHSLNEEGGMDANFGIGSYFFDRLFGAISRRHQPFNWTGYEIAKQRYLLEGDETDVDEESEW